MNRLVYLAAFVGSCLDLASGLRLGNADDGAEPAKLSAAQVNPALATAQQQAQTLMRQAALAGELLQQHAMVTAQQGPGTPPLAGLTPANLVAGAVVPPAAMQVHAQADPLTTTTTTSDSKDHKDDKEDKEDHKESDSKDKKKPTTTEGPPPAHEAYGAGAPAPGLEAMKVAFARAEEADKTRIADLERQLQMKNEMKKMQDELQRDHAAILKLEKLAGIPNQDGTASNEKKKLDVDELESQLKELKVLQSMHGGSSSNSSSPA